MEKDADSPAGWKPINFGWKYWNYAIIGIGLVTGFCVWVLPNPSGLNAHWTPVALAAELARLRAATRS